MIDATHDRCRSARQAKVLGTSAGARRLTLPAAGVCPTTLALMRRIDELHLERPFAGSPDAARLSLVTRGGTPSGAATWRR